MRIIGHFMRGSALALVLALAAITAPAQTTPAKVERVQSGNIVTENIPAVDTALGEKLSAYLAARSASMLDWTPDGKGILITTRFGETFQLHLVGGPMMARQQLTFAAEPITSAAFSPAKGSSDLVYVWDKGGSENFQFFHLDVATGKTTLITDGKSRNQGLVWNHKGDRFAFSSTRRDGKNTDVYVGGLKDAATVAPLVAQAGSWGAVAFSQDDARLLVGQYISITKSYLSVVDVATGALTRIKPEKDTIALTGVGFTTDAKGVFLTSDEEGEFKRLGLHDLASGKTTWITADDPWDVEEAVLSPDGKRLAYVLNEGGWSTLRVIDTKTLKPVKLPALPKGVIAGVSFSPDGSRLALSLTTPTAPADVHVVDLGKGKVEQWTKSEVGGLNTGNFADATLVQFPTFDQRQIPAFLFKPRNAKGKLPVIMLIHGGPEGQSRPNFSSTVQFWANELGAAVLLPNIRGSDGYGKTYLGLDNGFKREDSIKDIGALIDWVATQTDLDKDKIVVAGGSYGGYATLAAMTHYNDKLAGGANTVGISNFITFLEATAEYRRDLRRPEYGDERDPEMRAFLQKISPLTNASKITKPMLIIQGYNDPRVPVGEAEQMVAAIRKNGGEVGYVLAMDEGHGFKKKSNQFVAMMAQAQFFQKVFGQK
ncbi:S9 family peptidase [Niveispirillum sp.]|uniref:S9 family peptidase n=1 Tax=Niveispirillum sp. TaxID=1917217 RepID=UPI001B503A2F|nr:S9 family peptidase [Niveispirillum sp.]MBP7338258.1 S9 family peptidase [Niveispirillum sp.]